VLDVMLTGFSHMPLDLPRILTSMEKLCGTML